MFCFICEDIKGQNLCLPGAESNVLKWIGLASTLEFLLEIWLMNVYLNSYGYGDFLTWIKNIKYLYKIFVIKVLTHYKTIFFTTGRVKYIACDLSDLYFCLAECLSVYYEIL